MRRVKAKWDKSTNLNSVLGSFYCMTFELAIHYCLPRKLVPAASALLMNLIACQVHDRPNGRYLGIGIPEVWLSENVLTFKLNDL